jgi:hypothetical protein
MRATRFSEAKAHFSDCKPTPDGAWKGKLVFKSWGKKTNLHCFFKNLDTQEQHCISAFRSRNGSRTYAAKDGFVDFSESGIEGRIYKIQTGVNSKGNTSWLSAIEMTIPHKTGELA